MSGELEYWINNFNKKIFSKKAQGKKIYIWGAYQDGKFVKELLERNSFRVEGFIDDHKDSQEYLGLNIYNSSEILIRNDIFIVVAIKGVRNEIMQQFNIFKKAEDDYLYISQYVPRVSIVSCYQDYADDKGNRIIVGNNKFICRVTFIGFNNTLIIGRNFADNFEGEIILENQSTITIGENYKLLGNSKLEARDNGKLVIGDFGILMESSYIKAIRGKIAFGNYVTCGERLFCQCSKRSPIEMGNDCMLSHDVTILSTSSHSIFDLSLKKNISKDNEMGIEIHNHVWLGKGVTVLFNTVIGSGSIVGAASVVKGVFPDRSMIAGNLAHVVRENCTWDRRPEIEYDEI